MAYDTIADAMAGLKAIEPEEVEETEDGLETELEDDPTEDEELAEEVDETHPEPAIDPPAGWSEEEKEAFRELTPTLQEKIVRRERERDGLLTQKSQELSQRQKEAEERLKLLEEKEARYEAVLKKQQQDVPKLPDKSLLDPDSDDYDPDRYHRERANYDDALQRKQEAAEELKKLNEEHARDMQAQITEWQAEQQAIYREELPEILEPDSPLVRNIFSYAEQSRLDLDAVRAASAAEIIILNKARLWDEAMGKEPTKARSAPPSLKPGSPKSSNAIKSKRYEQLRAKAKKSGTLQDQLAFLKAAKKDK